VIGDGSIKNDGLTVGGFLRHALRWFRAHQVRVRRVPTDSGSGYISQSFRATAGAKCRAGNNLMLVHN